MKREIERQQDRQKGEQDGQCGGQTGRGLVTSGGSRFGVMLSLGKSGLHQLRADSNWS